MTGYDPEAITSNTLDTELELLESVAGGISSGYQANNRRLNQTAKQLRWAGWMLIAAPVSGAAIYLLIVAAISK